MNVEGICHWNEEGSFMQGGKQSVKQGVLLGEVRELMWKGKQLEDW